MPDGKGFDVIRELTIPVIIMTAQNSPENRLQGLQMGVHDFIPKPFLFQEVLLKMDHLLQTRVDVLKLKSGVEVDLKSRTIEESGSTTFLKRKRISNFKVTY